ncbi:hypothetical protein SYNPS1DRAFT_13139 [Syncephalis pseudoplumigaleata]|uniref:BRCT domain-containing protein n=1 Tax=Syncephalis pseudoplumigaleata TaxID=1712513 RepID=A0A4P9Z4Z1_9FUNG|nr:hypothetical protein SYNPS1DRAFT_13139 [Syncephalis pseudoplumigaleata]|eukprot:RKP27142.1 hypothetical protein SYNPS1DRAFT_13139 [Syncephalis pseudoplumigaleata]
MTETQAASSGPSSGNTPANPSGSVTLASPTSPYPVTSARFTVGKVDAGMAILLTEENQLIEFPSLLLPAGVGAGAVVNISVRRDQSAETEEKREFFELQEQVLREFGTAPPEPPHLQVRSCTQTSITLSWTPLVLHAADLRALEVYRDGERCHLNFPALESRWAKVTGLEVDREYKFYLRMRTSAGTFVSNTVEAKTHTLENLTGIHVSFGRFQKPAGGGSTSTSSNTSMTPREQQEQQDAIDAIKECIERIGAQWSDEVSADTTHLLARYVGGAAFDAAVRWNIPVVKPEWLFVCEQKGRLQPAGAYYLRRSSTSAASNTPGGTPR